MSKSLLKNLLPLSAVCLLAGCGGDDDGEVDSGMMMMTPDGGSMPGDGGASDSGTEEDAGPGEDSGPGEDAGPGLCDGVSCQNGTCNESNGSCDCDEGWEGDECETPVLSVTDELALWLDGADATTMTFNGNDVTAWEDKGPDALTFAPSATGPSLGSIGATPALTFDGTEDITGPGLSRLVNASQYTMFVVVSASDDDNVITAYGGGDSERMRLRDTEILGMTYSHMINTGTGGISFNSDPYAREEAHVITVEWTVGDTSMWVDGHRRQMEANTSPERLPSMESFTIGADLQSDQGENLNGSFGEVLVYSTRLSFAEREAVETYLGAKWGVGITHDVTSISTTQLWLDAANEDSLTTSGDSVSAWADLARGVSFDNAMGDQQPTLVADGMNGQPVLRFDGVNDSLSAANLGILSSREDYTVAVVFRRAAGSNTNGTVFYGSNDMNRPGLLVQAETGPERLRITHRNPPFGSGGQFVGATTGPMDMPMRALAQWAQDDMFRLDVMCGDGSVETDTETPEDPPHGMLNYIVGGSRPNATVDTFGGDIAEIIVFGRELRTPARDYLTAYLDNKWGFGSM